MQRREQPQRTVVARQKEVKDSQQESEEQDRIATEAEALTLPGDLPEG